MLSYGLGIHLNGVWTSWFSKPLCVLDNTDFWHTDVYGRASVNLCCIICQSLYAWHWPLWAQIDLRMRVHKPKVLLLSGPLRRLSTDIEVYGCACACIDNVVTLRYMDAHSYTIVSLFSRHESHYCPHYVSLTISVRTIHDIHMDLYWLGYFDILFIWHFCSGYEFQRRW
jgi:hypothetical protein